MGEIVNKLIERSKSPWSYAEFMVTALYDQEYGYYMKDNKKLGKEGDFYTSNHVHPVFPKTVARFFADIFKKEELPPVICEFGAGDGRFAKNALSYFKEYEEDLYKNIEYIMIESSPYHQEAIQETIKGNEDKVTVYSNFDEAIKEHHIFEGVLFSNELIDAFPVRIVEKSEDKLYEVKLQVSEEGSLKEVMCPLDQDMTKWIENYGPSLPNNYRTEINLAMKEWLGTVSSWINRGLVVTIDYGYSNEELLAPERREGSLRGYYKHQLIHNPLENPGEMDLTSHIQWDAFQRIAIENNLTEIFHHTQDKFLLRAGLFTFLEEVKDFNPFSDTYKLNRAIQSLVQPGGISSAFHVNVQGKGLENVEKYAFFNEDPYEWNRGKVDSMTGKMT